MICFLDLFALPPPNGILLITKYKTWRRNLFMRPPSFWPRSAEGSDFEPAWRCPQSHACVGFVADIAQHDVTQHRQPPRGVIPALSIRERDLKYLAYSSPNFMTRPGNSFSILLKCTYKTIFFAHGQRDCSHGNASGNHTVTCGVGGRYFWTGQLWVSLRNVLNLVEQAQEIIEAGSELAFWAWLCP